MNLITIMIISAIGLMGSTIAFDSSADRDAIIPKEDDERAISVVDEREVIRDYIAKLLEDKKSKEKKSKEATTSKEKRTTGTRSTQTTATRTSGTRSTATATRTTTGMRTTTATRTTQTAARTSLQTLLTDSDVTQQIRSTTERNQTPEE